MAAAISGKRHHEARPKDRESDAGFRDQPLGLALGGREGGPVGLGRAGNRDVHQPDRAAAVADRLQQPRDEIAVHGGRVAAGAVLQHAEAIDDDIDAVIAQQPRQRDRFHRHDRQFEIERAAFLRGEQFASDTQDGKPADAQIARHEAVDQTGGAEHQNFSDVGFHACLKRFGDHQPQNSHD